MKLRRSPLSTRFRLIARVLEVFLMVQIREDGSVRINPEEPLPHFIIPNEIPRPITEGGSNESIHLKTTDGNFSFTQLSNMASKEFAILNSFKANKNFCDLCPEVDAALAFISDSNNVIFHSYKIFLQLVTSLYSDKKFLDLLNFSSVPETCNL